MCNTYSKSRDTILSNVIMTKTHDMLYYYYKLLSLYNIMYYDIII